MRHVNDTVGFNGSCLESLKIGEIAATHVRAECANRCGSLIRPGQTGDFVAGRDERGDDV